MMMLNERPAENQKKRGISLDTMFLGTLSALILFPIVVALILLVVKSDGARGGIVKLSAVLIAAGSIFLAILYYMKGAQQFAFEGETISYIMMGIEICLALIIIVLSVKYKKYAAGLLAIIQTPIMVWFELAHGHGIEIGYNMYVDGLSIIMALIIGIIGSIITVYALGYMKDFQHHNPDQKDRRPWFFFVMFVFLAAMFGIVTSNNLIWMYFFWEITSLSSFFLIGYTKTEEAINNSFRALIMNLGGGLGFCLAIVFLGVTCQTVELDQLLSIGLSGGFGIYLVVPVGLLAFAGITKAAQMPFNSWLLGAMVAPTPVSALLHSSTMVKAGVFLMVKLSPLMGAWLPGASFGIGSVLEINFAGLMVMFVGGLTFFLASCAAISQSNAKRVLAYSTIANLGLIVLCAGLGTPAGVWAAIMLIIFHAIAKSLLFLSVGTTEHRIGSRDIEDMDGLFSRLPKVAIFMVIGICGMFIAPFGMLVSKWAGMVSIIEAGNPLIIMLLVFGSAVTLFFWAKWLGKLCAIVAGKDDHESIGIPGEEKFVLSFLSFLTVAVCLFFPVLSSSVVVPYLENIFTGADMTILASSNLIIMSILVAVLVLIVAFFFGKTKKRIVPIYLSGENVGDNITFRNSLKQPQSSQLKNWYMDAYFGEKKMNRIGIISTVFVIGCTFVLMVAYTIYLWLMLGGVA